MTRPLPEALKPMLDRAATEYPAIKRRAEVARWVWATGPRFPLRPGFDARSHGWGEGRTLASEPAKRADHFECGLDTAGRPVVVRHYTDIEGNVREEFYAHHPRAAGCCPAWEYNGAVKQSSIERALEAMESMEKGKPYSLRPDDKKRRLVDEIERICRDLKVKPVVIGGLAVNHHGYLRVTADVDVLVAADDAMELIRRLKSEPGWKRYAEGFKNTILDVGLDICVEGQRTSPASMERFPSPAALKRVRVHPLPVPALADLIALKVKSGRLRDDGDVGELLKRHASKISSLRKAVSRLLETDAARAHLDEIIVRVREELKRRPRDLYR